MDIEELSSFVVHGSEDPVAHFARKIEQLNPQPQDLEPAAEYLKRRTVSQTLSGFDVRSHPFAPYSPLYAKKKGSSEVNLFGSRGEPHMLDLVDARVSVSPAVVEVGIFDNPEVAMRAAVHNEGLMLMGREARSFIKSLVHRSYQKVAGLKRRLKNQRSIIVIPKREWLAVTRQDLRIISELIVRSITNRLRGDN